MLTNEKTERLANFFLRLSYYIIVLFLGIITLNIFIGWLIIPTVLYCFYVFELKVSEDD